jgi:hypothetical protein
METGSISTESPARQSLSENTESLQPGSAIFPFLGDFAGRFDPHCVKVVAVLFRSPAGRFLDYRGSLVLSIRRR